MQHLMQEAGQFQVPLVVLGDQEVARCESEGVGLCCLSLGAEGGALVAVDVPLHQ